MRIKDVVEIKNTKTDDHTKPYIGLENIESWNSKFIPTESVSEGTNNEYDKGDILFGKLRPYLAKGYIATESGVCSTEFFVLHAKKGFSNKYLLYRFLTPSFIGYINSKVAGVKMPRTNWSDFSSTSIDIPFLDVQKRIVSYLDAETAKIDHAIELLKKKREAYTRLKSSVINRAVTRGLNPNAKLKDSGVEWIGMIPEGWDWHRLKDLGYMYSGLTGKSGDDFRSNDLSITKPYIPFTNVLNHIEIDPNQMNFVVMDEGEMQNRVIKGDLIFLMSSEDYESIAKSALVSEDIEETYLNSFCRGYRFTKAEADAKFVNYELNSELYRNAIRYEARGFTRINIKVDRIETMLVILPALSEQHAIADYLDSRCYRIDRAATIVDKQIDAYTRLKKSLINEVVTGKRKI